MFLQNFKNYNSLTSKLVLCFSLAVFVLSLEACRKPTSEAGIKKTIVGKWQKKNSDFILEFTTDEVFSYREDSKRDKTGSGTKYSIQKDKIIYETSPETTEEIIEKLNKKELYLKTINKKNDNETIEKYKRVQ